MTLLQCFQRTSLQQTSTEVNVYMRRHQTRSSARTTLVTLIYHKFSHDDVSFRINGENINVSFRIVFSSTNHPDVFCIIFFSAIINFSRRGMMLTLLSRKF